ncbi:DNA sulfur modification protein DndD [Halorubrum ezzemoulense]|uniref:DNA sulfur modification protein DndD n=1 Tax=Halorubrum ezzemoulense TaxID=337243 RepID=UPI00232C7BF4|nr:DNA sulfur modification protein DndD [Halorubrum ezzemoulense]MDB9302395.1 DNA sulfur modification protein DndD [Halorubrum ezzemoulense]
MRIQRIVLTDYGPYGGHNEINLETTKDRPIILFGGQNGSGKTTLFNAIQICLHGRSAFEETLSRREYEERMQALLHESGGQKAEEASIRLEFEYTDFGQAERYTVERSFRDRGKSLVEDVSIRRDGSELSELEEEQWEDFLKELIPPGISQLFFFDGEKVENLAKAIEDDSSFTESLMSLLGLDLVEQLENDMTVYRSHKLDENGHEELAAEIDEYRENIEQAENEKSQLEDKIERKTKELENIEAEIESAEQQLAEEGGTFAEKRDEYKERRTELRTEITKLKEDIRDIATGSYPFALAPGLCRDVIERLENESKISQQQAARSEAVNALSDVAEDDAVWGDLDVPEGASTEVVERLQDALSEQLTPENVPEYELSSEFSQREQQEMTNAVNRALNEIPGELQELTDELEKKMSGLNDVEAKISNAPDQSVIAPQLKKINELNKKRGELESEVEKHRERLEQVENNLSRLNSGLENRLDRQDEFDDISRRADLSMKVQETIRDYRETLTNEKLDRLEDVLTDRYLELSNKSEFYEQVIVDKEDTTIYIETQAGDTKHQSQLSAGERQIFATALLWALADISGRPLPFIIDTPLGRLDKEHRSRLVENFFPKASHQVFLFSTDTEITDTYHDELQQYIAAEFKLENSQETGETSISAGYFNVDSEDAVQDDNRYRVSSSENPSQVDIEGYTDD